MSNGALRIAAVIGMLATLALLFLGFIWPSIYTFIAIFALAAPLTLVVSLVRPAILRERPLLRGYVALCVALAVASWAFQFVWLAL